MNDIRTHRTLTNDQIAAERASITAAQDNRNKRINECQTEESDCFLSIRAENHRLELLEKMEALNAASGLATFSMLTDLQGNPVDAFAASTKFGNRFCVEGQWMPHYGPNSTDRKLANLAAKGYKFTDVQLPAVVATEAGGSYNWWATIVPAQRLNNRIVLNGRVAEEVVS